MIIPSGASVVHSQQPYIAEYTDFFTKKQCKAIMKLRKQLSYVQGQLRYNGRREVNLEQRKAFTHVIAKDDPEALTQWYARVTEWLQLPSVDWIENALFIHYPHDGVFHVHTDAVANHLPDGTLTRRVATLIVYVNDDYQGGRTIFPVQRIGIEPQAGKALLFTYDYDDETNRNTVHMGQRVEGNKYIMVFFIRDQACPDQLRALTHY
jgi:hypothetical protein